MTWAEHANHMVIKRREWTTCTEALLARGDVLRSEVDSVLIGVRACGLDSLEARLLAVRDLAKKRTEKMFARALR